MGAGYKSGSPLRRLHLDVGLRSGIPVRALIKAISREKKRHDGTSKDVVSSKKSRHVHKQRKTTERQSLTNSHRQSRWISIDLED